MKTFLPFLSILIGLSVVLPLAARAQTNWTTVRAGFGVDGDVNANFYNNISGSGFYEDWFAKTSGTLVIDTTGAAALKAHATSDANFRKLPFYRIMRVPQLSKVNNRLWLDAIYIRDYSGQSGADSTAFISANKNGQSPVDWTGGASQVGDKNDISDMFLHVRRAGPNATDSLWLMGGLSIQGTGGQRYFDFELYQTDIFYTRSTGKFTGYGPDAGHTSWKFDASGNIIAPGDIILSAEYQSAGLTNIQARIWVDKSALSLTPASFSWAIDPSTGKYIFDGASTGSQFGYAAIMPNSVGNYYTGLDNKFSTWAGPFGFVNGSNAVVDNFAVGQFMEFSVNLSQLGLDPMTLLTGSSCDLPFRKILVKTRTSVSFTASLTDFIGPFDFFLTPPVEATTNVPMYCGTYGSSQLMVTNALEASVYTWKTYNGHFVGDSVGSSVTVDKPGTYIVTQQLMDGCSAYASDTVTIVFDGSCSPLSSTVLNFSGSRTQRQTLLKWTTSENNHSESFVVQRSLDGQQFENVATLKVVDPQEATKSYAYADNIEPKSSPYIFYRLAIKGTDGKVAYSRVIKFRTVAEEGTLNLYPNPAAKFVQVTVQSEKDQDAAIDIFDATGKKVYLAKRALTKGANVLTINEISNWQAGMYLVRLSSAGDVQWKKLVVASSKQ